jgi:hypothetical protein
MASMPRKGLRKRCMGTVTDRRACDPMTTKLVSMPGHDADPQDRTVQEATRVSFAHAAAPPPTTRTGDRPPIRSGRRCSFDRKRQAQRTMEPATQVATSDHTWLRVPSMVRHSQTRERHRQAASDRAVLDRNMRCRPNPACQSSRWRFLDRLFNRGTFHPRIDCKQVSSVCRPSTSILQCSSVPEEAEAYALAAPYVRGRN